MTTSSISTYHLTAPLPLPSRPGPVHTGRGGAGNFILSRPKATPSQPYASSSSHSPSSSTSPTSSQETLVLPNLSLPVYPPPPGLSSSSGRPSRQRKNNYISTGRGGWGNLHPASETAMFSFDEELEKICKAQENMAPVYHIGRGGAGNSVSGRRRNSSQSMRSESSCSESSSAEGESEGERGFRRAMERMWRGWKW